MHSKPVIMSEYGAETVQGLHLLPAFVFSEEFQTKLLSKHFEAFDKLRREDFFIGEFVYSYADFNAAQSEFEEQIISQPHFKYLYVTIQVSTESDLARKVYLPEIVNRKPQRIYCENVISTLLQKSIISRNVRKIFTCT